MRYELLGPLRVRDGNRTSFISAQKIEILLATLLVRADHVVGTDEIMAEIWGERMPRRAAAGIHVYVSELRKFLNRPEHSQSPIVTRSPGYLLCLSAEDELDYRSFVEMVDRGRVCLREERVGEACAHLEGAQAMWRGPAFGEASNGQILRSFATWLTELRLEGTELLMDARLRLGRHREAVGTLYSLVAENPLREVFYRQLMLALYRSERRADALQVYHQARRTLADELGLEPCTALRELHTAILTADEGVLCAAA